MGSRWVEVTVRGVVVVGWACQANRVIFYFKVILRPLNTVVLGWNSSSIKALMLM